MILRILFLFIPAPKRWKRCQPIPKRCQPILKRCQPIPICELKRCQPIPICEPSMAA